MFDDKSYSFVGYAIRCPGYYEDDAIYRTAYVPYINHTYGGSGSIWEGRYKANLVQEESYLLTCMRYIELNPVCANIVPTPEQYRWSSLHRNGRGEKDGLDEAGQI
ncbi:MAG: hypothetical protein DID89_2727548610 [Candidatus Nitrotoga sp. CP45]|nr:MAG: hypothetical protein DID89_2727548610 [Candidatus Nitrotoga sp. CP45]